MLPDRKILRNFPIRKSDIISEIVNKGISSDIIVECTVESIARKSVLCLWYFDVKNHVFTHRSFIFYSPEKNEFDYITHQIKPCKWLKSNLSNLSL